MLKKKLSVLTGVLVVAVLLIVALLRTPEAHAINRPTNAGVFTGRFIPAFIGGAYDPSVAYEAMAGLPVYVIAYDDWADPAAVDPGESTWVISDLAVKTQIRADGTFQAQGVPFARQYGVYFPFAFNGTKTVRTDCGKTVAREGATGTANLESNVCYDPSGSGAYDNKIWPFRMPRQEDGIVDVFSYAANYLAKETDGTDIGGNVAVQFLDTQLETAPASDIYQKIRLEHVFITQRTELDIENNINTFPLIPTTNIRLDISTVANRVSGSPTQVYAQRIGRPYTAGGIGDVPRTNSPIIKGTAILTDNTTLTFQSYAPTGIYAVTLWEKESDSASYNSWDGESSLNTRKSAFVQYCVDSAMVGQTCGDDSDWRNTLAFPSTEKISINENKITLWGTVSDSLGLLATNYQIGGPDHNDAVIITSENSFTYASSGTPVSGRMIKTDAVSSITSPTSPPTPSAPITTYWGMYAVTIDPTFNLLGGFDVPVSDQLSVRYNTEGVPNNTNVYSKSPASTGLIHSSQGPRKLDLVLTQDPAGTAKEGYTNGVLFEAKLENGQPAAGARLTFWISEPEDVSAAGETKHYYLDRLGELYLPTTAIEPRAGSYDPSTAIQYIAQIHYPGSVHFEPFEYDFSASAYLEKINNIQLNNISHLRKSNNHNLAILNKVEDLINNQDVYAAGALARIPIELNLPEDQGSIDGAVNVFVYLAESNQPCLDDCFFYDSPTTGGTQLNPATTDFGNYSTFYVEIPVPAIMISEQAQCLNDGLPPEECDKYPNVAATSANYEIRAQTEIDGTPLFADQTFSVSDQGISSPPVISLNLAQNCASVGAQVSDTFIGGTDEDYAIVAGLKDAVANVGNSLIGVIAETSCSFGMYVAESIPGLMGMVFKYGLQTRALTQDQAIIDMFDIVRTITNVLFVIIFVIVGIMTILRYQPEQWHVSILLPRLITGLVLANFSLLIAQAILDLNNFASFAIFEMTESLISARLTPTGASVTGIAGVGGGMAVVGAMGSSISAVATGIAAMIAGVVGTGGGLLIPIAAVVIAICVVVFGQVMSLLLVIFMRYLIIWLGVIAAPIIFLVSVLPWFAGFRQKWWKTMITISTVQTVIAGLLSVGVLLLTIGSANFSLVPNFGPILVAFVVFYAATKAPAQMVGASVGGFSVNASQGISAMRQYGSQKFDQQVEKGKQRYKQNLQQDENFRQDYGLKNDGKQPGFMRMNAARTARAGKRALRGVASTATFGAIGGKLDNTRLGGDKLKQTIGGHDSKQDLKKSERERKTEARQTALRNYAQENNLTNLQAHQASQLSSMYAGMPEADVDDDQLYTNNLETMQFQQNSKGHTMQSLFYNEDGSRKSQAEYLKKMNDLASGDSEDRSVYQKLMRDAQRHEKENQGKGVFVPNFKPNNLKQNQDKDSKPKDRDYNNSRG